MSSTFEDEMALPAEGVMAGIAADAEAIAAPAAPDVSAPGGARKRRRRPGRPTRNRRPEAAADSGLVDAADTEPAAAAPAAAHPCDEALGRLIGLSGALVADLVPGGPGGELPADEREAMECVKTFGLALLAKYAPGFEYIEETGFGLSLAVLWGLQTRRKRREQAGSVARPQGLGQNAPALQPLPVA